MTQSEQNHIGSPELKNLSLKNINKNGNCNDKRNHWSIAYANIFKGKIHNDT